MAANEFSLPLVLRVVPLPNWVRRWLPLVLLLTLALAVRLPFAPDPAYRGDLIHFARWIEAIDTHGLTHFYDADLRMGAWDRPYPPLPTYAFGLMRQLYGSVPDPRMSLNDIPFVLMLKFLPLVAELALIAAVHLWLAERQTWLAWMIPGLLALHPGLMATSAWWGQYDAPFTVFLVLALISLNRDRPLQAWVLFALALLIKQPAAALAPLFLVVTFRRYGWRETALGIAAGVGLYALLTLPFALGSGLTDSFSPYLKASDAFPFFSNNAYNGWYGLAWLIKGGPMLFQEPQFRDSLPFLGPLTAKNVGFLLLGGFTLWMMVVMWRQAHERREFVWAATFFVGFFMLPTQVHERYLYPATVLALVAIAQDRRFWWPALGLIVTMSYNVLAVLVPNRWPGVDAGTARYALSVAIVNLVIFLQLLRLTWFPEPEARPLPRPTPAQPTTLSRRIPTLRE